MVCFERWCSKVSDYPVVPGDPLKMEGDTVYLCTEENVPIAVLPSPIPGVESVECSAIRIYEVKLKIVCEVNI
jgi:hypothetical protein